MFAFRLSLLLLASCGRACLGDVVVLANRTGREVAVRMVDGLYGGPTIKVPAMDTLPIETNGPCEVEVAAPGLNRRFHLAANTAYFFGSLSDGRVAMQQIGLGGDDETDGGRKLPGAGRDIATIRVKIAVDDEEPELERRWKERLRRRVEAASDVLERYCRVRLRVVAYGTWNSDNTTTEFPKSMAEFEREVDPLPASLVIGFSSQYHVPEGQTHLGGTRGPLHSHVLLREWSRHVNERVRVELLLHELGHHLGAAHSPEATSVMRPVLTNRNAEAAGPRIRFDPVNTLVMYLVAEEMRRRNVQGFADLTPETKQRLGQIYTALSRANPRDDSAKRFIQLVQHPETADPLEQATRTVLEAVVAAAEAEQRRNVAAAPEQDVDQGDRLTEQYVRRAAAAASRFDEKTGPRAFLLAVGIAMDDSQSLRVFPQTAEFVAAVESEAALLQRLSVLGGPTILGRDDLAKHFFISAHLTAAFGFQMAATAGESKELLDATTDSGFSFADMAANRAGITFARRVSDRSISLDDLPSTFTVDDFMPPIDGLEEGLSLADFRAKYGGKDDDRYAARLAEIDRRIEALAAYRRIDVATD